MVNYRKAQLYCPAKINLHLQVGRLFSQGQQTFHRVCTLIQAVYLQASNDRLQIHLSSQSVDKASAIQIQLQVQPQAPCKQQQNLVYRAAKAYLDIVSQKSIASVCNPIDWPQTICFTLQKVIPQQAGLGGGSSNAAATLKLLNQCLPDYCGQQNLRLDQTAMQALAASLGTDIPFFLQDFCHFADSIAWGLGRGEKIVAPSVELITALKQFQAQHQLWLIKPQAIACNTRQMYQILDARPNQPIEFDYRQLEQKLSVDKAPISKLFYNDFQSVIRQHYNKAGNLSQKIQKERTEAWKVLAILSEYLYSLSASWVALSGSGSAFFAWFPQDKSSSMIFARLADFANPLDVFIANPMLSNG